MDVMAVPTGPPSKSNISPPRGRAGIFQRAPQYMLKTANITSTMAKQPAQRILTYIARPGALPKVSEKSGDR